MGNRSKWRGSRYGGPPSGFDDGPPGFGIPTSSPFTFEGQLERRRAFAAGLIRRGRAGKAFVWFVLLTSLAIFVVAQLAGH
ncbi:MAG TPA: hypothetical protein VHE83_11735 [Mycobacteriales bacterium]|nr:hypothetical protein [Mycobacteriales bacterium]